MTELPRRKFLAALGFAACASAIVRASSLMPARAFAEDDTGLLISSSESWGHSPWGQTGWDRGFRPSELVRLNVGESIIIGGKSWICTHVAGPENWNARTLAPSEKAI